MQSLEDRGAPGKQASPAASLKRSLDWSSRSRGQEAWEVWRWYLGPWRLLPTPNQLSESYSVTSGTLIRGYVGVSITANMCKKLRLRSERPLSSYPIWQVESGHAWPTLEALNLLPHPGAHVAWNSLKLTIQFKYDFDFWSSWLHFLNTGLTDMCHQAQFLKQRWNPRLCSAGQALHQLSYSPGISKNLHKWIYTEKPLRSVFFTY